MPGDESVVNFPLLVDHAVHVMNAVYLDAVYLDAVHRKAELFQVAAITLIELPQGTGHFGDGRFFLNVLSVPPRIVSRRTIGE